MGETQVMPRPGTTRQVSAGLLHSLRVAIIAQAAALLVAASFAGQAVSAGGGPVAETHVMAGMVVHLVALVQIVLAILVWRPGRGAGWPVWASVALFVVGGLQHVTWLWLGAHLPNGVLLFGLIGALLVWSWSPSAARRR
ncbi:hypothetical protein [Nonomuraea sp. NPDC049684]|uniref:hypothetical protein n=1 Tax=unclassified Nonomuraea TaxID=2593643 RepID=UPI00378A4DAC